MRALLLIISIFFITPAFADEEFDDFLKKIKENDISWVEKFLEIKAKESGRPYGKLNHQDSELMFRPIFMARSPEMLRTLVDAGATLPTEKGDDEFLEAILADNVELVREIIDTGTVDVNSCFGLIQRRAVMFAYSPEMVMLLIERGALLCNARRSREEYVEQSHFQQVHDAMPYADEEGNNALHVLAQTATRLLRRFPGDDDLRRRIEATGLFLIRQDLDAGQQNPGRAILAMRNSDSKTPRALFQGHFWGTYFLERLGPLVVARPRPAVPTLNIIPMAEVQGVLVQRPQLVLAPIARPLTPVPLRRPATDNMGIERTASPNIFGDSSNL